MWIDGVFTAWKAVSLSSQLQLVLRLCFYLKSCSFLFSSPELGPVFPNVDSGQTHRWDLSKARDVLYNKHAQDEHRVCVKRLLKPNTDTHKESSACRGQRIHTEGQAEEDRPWCTSDTNSQGSPRLLPLGSWEHSGELTCPKLQERRVKLSNLERDQETFFKISLNQVGLNQLKTSFDTDKLNVPSEQNYINSCDSGSRASLVLRSGEEERASGWIKGDV